jgi:hypothetical protein
LEFREVVGLADQAVEGKILKRQPRRIVGSRASAFNDALRIAIGGANRGDFKVCAAARLANRRITENLWGIVSDPELSTATRGRMATAALNAVAKQSFEKSGIQRRYYIIVTFSPESQ